MAVLDYTTYDDVRAALGVSEDELEDATLSLSLYEFSLSADIRSVSLTLSADYATVANKDPGARTEDEIVLLESASLFATYSVARHLLTSLPLFSPKEITDGKASAVRYSINPYKDTMDRVESMYSRYRDALTTAYAAYKVTSATTRTVPIFMAVSQPGTDPVTGE